MDKEHQDITAVIFAEILAHEKTEIGALIRLDFLP
jgi:hypothetical protein